jgi:hypothetical protein
MGTPYDYLKGYIPKPEISKENSDTTDALSYLTKYAAPKEIVPTLPAPNMPLPDLSAIKDIIPNATTDKPAVVGTSPLAQSYGQMVTPEIPLTPEQIQADQLKYLMEPPKDMVPGIAPAEMSSFLTHTVKQTGVNLATILAGFQDPMDVFSGRADPTKNNVYKAFSWLANKGKTYSEDPSTIIGDAKSTGESFIRMPYDLIVKPAVDFVQIVDAMEQYDLAQHGSPFHMVDRNAIQGKMDNVVSNAVGMAAGAAVGKWIGAAAVKGVEREAVSTLGERALGGKVAQVGSATLQDVVNASVGEFADKPLAMKLTSVLENTPTMDKLLSRTGGFGVFGGTQAAVATQDPNDAFINMTKAAAFQTIAGVMFGAIAQYRGKGETSAYKPLADNIRDYHLTQSLMTQGSDFINDAFLHSMSKGMDIVDALAQNIQEGKARRFEGVPYLSEADMANPNAIVHKVGDGYSLIVLGKDAFSNVPRHLEELKQYGHITGEVVNYQGGDYFISKQVGTDRVWLSPTYTEYVSNEHIDPNIISKANSILVERNQIKGQPQPQFIKDPHSEIPLNSHPDVIGPLYHGTPNEHVIEDNSRITLTRKVGIGEPTQYLDSKIGTGEMAQAYSKGHYFAERIGVSDYYRPQGLELFDTGLGKLTGDQIFRAYYKEGTIVPSEFVGHYYEVIRYDKTLDAAEVRAVAKDPITGEWKPTGSPSKITYDFPKSRAIKEVLGGTGEIVGNTVRGQSYTNFLHATQNELIHWDKSFWNQSDLVKNAISKIVYDMQQSGNSRLIDNTMMEHLYNDNTPIGRIVGWASGKYKGIGQYGAFEQMLRDEGVVGVKYADASRHDANGPKGYNYVVYNTERIHGIRNSGEVAQGKSHLPMSSIDFDLNNTLQDNPQLRNDYKTRLTEITNERVKAAADIYSQAFNKGYTVERMAGSDTYLIRDINGHEVNKVSKSEVESTVKSLPPFNGDNVVPPITPSHEGAGPYDGGDGGSNIGKKLNYGTRGVGNWLEQHMNTGWFSKFLSPMYNKFSYFEKRTGARYLNDFFLPVQDAIMKFRAALQPFLSDLHSASKIAHQFNLETLDKITEGRETFSAKEMESGIPTVLQARAVNAKELAFGKDLTTFSTSTDRAIAYTARRMREMLAGVKEGSQQHLEIKTMLDQYLEVMTPNQHRVLQQFDNILNNFDKSQVNLYAVNRYAHALEFNTLSRADFIKANSFDVRHIQVMDALDKFYKEAANRFEIDADLIGGYHPHYRMFNEAIVKHNISMMEPAIRSVADFVSEMDRIGEIQNYMKDPFFVANMYIRSVAKNRILAPEVLKAQMFLDNLKGAHAREHGAAFSLEIYKEGTDFLNEVLGKKSTIDALSEGLANIDKNATTVFLNNLFGEKFATTLAGIVESSVQGFKPMAGIRDLSSFAFQSYKRFGAERTMHMLSLWGKMEDILQKNLAQGKQPGLELDQVILREVTEGNIPAPMAWFFTKGFEWSLQKQVYVRAYALSMLETKMTVLEQLAKLNRGDISHAKFEDKIWLDTYDLPVINEFNRIMFTEKNAVKAAEYLGDISARELVGHYGAANQASAFRSKFGRLMGQFSQWNTMMLQNNIRMLRTGTLERKLGTALRFGVLMAASKKTQDETGIKLSFYMPFVTNPRVGPVFSFMNDVSTAASNNYDMQRQTAWGAVRKELDPWRTIIWNPTPLFLRNAAMRYINGDDAALIGAEILGIPLDTKKYPKSNPSF